MNEDDDRRARVLVDGRRRDDERGTKERTRRDARVWVGDDDADARDVDDDESVASASASGEASSSIDAVRWWSNARLRAWVDDDDDADDDDDDDDGTRRGVVGWAWFG